MRLKRIALGLALGMLGVSAGAWGVASLHRQSAWRLVGAPNYDKAKAAEPRHEAVSEAFRVAVGPPSAELDVWVLEPSRPATGTVVVLHGFYDRKRTMVGFGKMLRTSNGLRTVLVDLRGHGHSTGDFSTFGLMESRDLVQVLDALQARGQLTPPLSLYGPSFGATVALHTAARDARVERVVAVATYGSFERVLEPYIDHFHPPLAWVLPRPWSESVVDRANVLAGVELRDCDNLAAIRATRARVLIMHGARDELIPVAEARALYDACGPERCKLVLFPEANHGESMSGARLNEETLAWLKRKPTRTDDSPGRLTVAEE